MESRSDADWCWHCGYSYEDADSGKPPATDSLTDNPDQNDPAVDTST